MIELVIEQRRRLGGGMEVGRVLPFAKRRMIGHSTGGIEAWHTLQAEQGKLIFLPVQS